MLAYDWTFWARPSQLPPVGDWRFWLMLAGRGAGKSRAGAEWVRAQVESGRCSRIALVAPTAADARDVLVEGESGLLSVCPPWDMPEYSSSNRRVTWPNGAIATLYSAEEPDRLRGPQHDGGWCDEIAAWRYAQDTWDQLLMTLRLGSDPRAVVTTTPRPIGLIKSLLADPTCHVTRGTTYDNLSNLAPAFAAQIISRYEGTRLGRQELLAEVLDDTPGALWVLAQIEALRVTAAPASLRRVVVAIDPAATNTEDSDETGIVVCGLDDDGRGYVLADLSLKASPDGWARRAVAAYHEFGADRIVYESNQGGDMVAHTLHTVDKTLPLRAVHASRGKRTRAEPVAALYEQAKVLHVGAHAKLEDQMCGWCPDVSDKSPDRVDALVWALTDLMLTGRSMAVVAPTSIEKPSIKSKVGTASRVEPDEDDRTPPRRMGRVGW